MKTTTLIVSGLLLAVLTGCGHAPATTASAGFEASTPVAPQEQAQAKVDFGFDAPKDVQDRIQRGEVTILYVAVGVKAKVLSRVHRFDPREALWLKVEATANSPFKGSFEVKASQRDVPSNIDVGHVVRMNVHYAHVEVKTRRIVALNERYHATDLEIIQR